VTTNELIVSRQLDEIIPRNDPYLRTHRKRYERTLSVFLDQKPKPGTLLEIGTSSVFPLALKSLTPKINVHVTDYDLTKSPKGSKTLQLGDFLLKVPTYRVNLETTALPVENELFDYVVCSEVIEHMEQDPMFMLSELNRVLKPGGMLLLTTPNIASSSGLSRMLKGLDPYFYMQYRKAGTLDRHNYEYTVYSLSQTLKAAGFEGYVWTEDTFSAPASLPVEELKRLGYPMQHLGDNIFTVSKKAGPVVNRHPSVIYAD
jgi:SAM-dependent methyltransferase